MILDENRSLGKNVLSVAFQYRSFGIVVKKF